MKKSRLLGALSGCLIALIWTSSNASSLYAANNSGIWEFDPATGLGSMISTENVLSISYVDGYLFSSNGTGVHRYEIATDTWSMLSNGRRDIMEYGDGVLYTSLGVNASSIVAIDSLTGDASTFSGIDGVTALAYAGTTVPLPPALYLFGSGLLGLIGIARKKAA